MKAKLHYFRENDMKEKQSVKSDASNSVKQVRKNAVMPSTNLVSRCVQGKSRFSVRLLGSSGPTVQTVP